MSGEETSEQIILQQAQKIAELEKELEQHRKNIGDPISVRDDFKSSAYLAIAAEWYKDIPRFETAGIDVMDNMRYFAEKGWTLIEAEGYMIFRWKKLQT